jgi:hypothetical protein
MTVPTVVEIPSMLARIENALRRKIIIRADMLLCRLLCAYDRLKAAL